MPAFCQPGSCRGSMGKRRRPCPINRHAATKVAGCWGPRRSALAPCFSAKPSQSAPWARGLLLAFWERGSPDLPACGLRRGSSGGPVRPIFINSSSRPTRMAKLRRADDGRLPQERPHQAGSRGGREIKARVPREVLVAQAMTIKAKRAPACAVSSFPLWCKGGKHRCGVSRHQAKVSISVQRDQDQKDAGWRSPWIPRWRHHQRLWHAKTTFCQDNSY